MRAGGGSDRPTVVAGADRPSGDLRGGVDDRILFRERIAPAGWAGTAIAFVGVALITVGAEGNLRPSRGALLVVLAALCATGYGLFNKQLVARYRALDLTTWAIWAGTLGLVGYTRQLLQTVPLAPAMTTLHVGLLGIVPGAMCYALWAFAMSRMPLARLASWMFAIPVAAVAFGWLLLDELPPRLALVGGAITLAGVCLVNTRGPAGR